ALLGAVVCVLVAFKVLPVFQTGTDLSRQPALIVNDTSAAVVVAHCDDRACTSTSGRASVPAGHSLRVGSGQWVIEDSGGGRTGRPTAPAGPRLPGADAGACLA